MGYIVGDVAMDSMVTDLAQREPLAERGQLQSQIYLVRTVAMSLTAALTSFGFSSVEYGGTFAWYVPHSRHGVVHRVSGVWVG